MIGGNEGEFRWTCASFDLSKIGRVVFVREAETVAVAADVLGERYHQERS